MILSVLMKRSFMKLADFSKKLVLSNSFLVFIIFTLTLFFKISMEVKIDLIFL